MRALPLLALILLAPLFTQANPPLATGPVALFATGIPGPEGLAFDNTGLLYVGTSTGHILVFTPDGNSTVLADVGDPLAGVTVRRNGHVLAAAFGAGRVWSVDPGGAASVLASGITGVNFVAETRRGQVFASVSGAGNIVDIASGTPVVRASGLTFPNGLAIGPDRYLYVAETFASRISRLPLAKDGTLGAAEVYATGTPAADGIAFDRHGNLLVVGGDQVLVVDRGTRAAAPLVTDPLVDWPANIAFGRGHGFPRRNVYLVNYGLPLGSGRTVARLGYNHAGARLVR